MTQEQIFILSVKNRSSIVVINEMSNTVLEGELKQNPRSTLRRSKKKLNHIVNPIVNTLADSLGISPRRAQMVVGYAVIILQTVVQQNHVPSREVSQIGTVLEDLFKADYAYRTGMAHRLSRATGLTVDEAAFGLEKAMILLNEQCLFN